MESIEHKSSPEHEKNEREEIYKMFIQIKNKIEDDFKIKLTNIEVVGLRKIVEKCLEDVQDIKGGFSRFTTGDEAVERFLNEFYGISTDSINWVWRIKHKGKIYEIEAEDDAEAVAKLREQGVIKHLTDVEAEYVPSEKTREEIKYLQQKSHKP